MAVPAVMPMVLGALSNNKLTEKMSKGLPKKPWLALLGLGGVCMVQAGCDIFSPITSPIQERGVTGFLDDNMLRLSLNASLLSSGIPGIEQVEFLIHKGVVLLIGMVDTPEIKQRVVRHTQKVRNIKKVIDEIQVVHKGLIDYAKDAWMGHKLRSLLFFDARILSQNYHLRVVNRIIYLMGIAQSQKELDHVLEHAESLPDVRQVIPYIEVLKPKP